MNFLTTNRHRHGSRHRPSGSGAGDGPRSSRRSAATLAALVAALVIAVVGTNGCVTTMPPLPVVHAVLSAAGQAAVLGTERSVVHNDDAPFSVGIIPNRVPPVRIGDEVGFLLSASTTGYGHLYLISASGGVLVLAENLVVNDGGQTEFPAPESGFTLRASPPAGHERVLFLMTRQPFKGFGGGTSGPVQLPLRENDFISDLNAATRLLPDSAWTLAETSVEVVPEDGSAADGTDLRTTPPKIRQSPGSEAVR